MQGANYKKGITMSALLTKLMLALSLIFFAAEPSLAESLAPAKKVQKINTAITPSGMVDEKKLLIPGPLPDIIEGSDTAPITIVEYYSLSCGHCANFHLHDLPIIRKKYIETGRVRLIKREYPYDSRATAGFMLARCAPKAQYNALIDVLYDKFMSWVPVADALPPLEKIARLSGFTTENFKACLQNEDLLKKVNSSFERGRNEFGVTASPTFFINGEKYVGAFTADELSKILDSLLRHV